MKTTYQHIQQRLDKIDFQALWPGFKRYEFALYDDQHVILNDHVMPKTGEFVANTSINYQGRQIAIWYLKEDMDLDVLTSKIVHEMFHAYQNDQHEQRFPNEFEAIFHYRYTPQLLWIKLHENRLLKQLVQDFDQAYFDLLMRWRKTRKQTCPYEYEYESKIESIEGTATYVEWMVLLQLSQEKYEEVLKRKLEQLEDLHHYIPARILSYDVGALLLMVCQTNAITIDQSIQNNSTLLFDPLTDQVEALKEISLPDVSTHDFYHQDQRQLKQKIESIIQNPAKTMTGRYKLIVFNVYSAREYQGYIFSEHLLIIADQKNHTMYGNFVFKMEDGMVVEVYKQQEGSE